VFIKDATQVILDEKVQKNGMVGSFMYSEKEKTTQYRPD